MRIKIFKRAPAPLFLLAMALMGSVAGSASAQAANDSTASRTAAAFLAQNDVQSQSDFQKTVETELAARQVQSLAGAQGPQCFTSGIPAGSPNDIFGISFLKVCITDRGNISHFESPANKVHLQNREGYAVCSDEGNVVHGFDAGIAERGWSLAPTASQPNGPGTLPLIITRATADAKIRLTQTFTLNQGEREVQVAMTVQNVSASVLPQVVLDRYFDGDLNGTSTNDHYDTSTDSVLGIDGLAIKPNYGLILTLAPFSAYIPVNGHIPHPVSPRVQKYADWNPNGSGARLARRCGGYFLDYPAGYSTTGGGDFIGRLSSDVSDLKPGQSKTYTYKYRRI
jgi:hypothetical protein